jgi:Fe2+ or Zn2+ uptake regulation protein
MESTPDFVELVRTTSRDLFGSRHRLEVAACIAKIDEAINPRGVYERLHELGFDTPEAKVGQHLRQLAGLHVLDRVNRPNEATRVFYKRCESCVWDMTVALMSELTAIATTQSSRPARRDRTD